MVTEKNVNVDYEEETEAGVTDQSKRFIAIVHKKRAEYKEMGLHGEPCTMFPGLRINSSDEEIEQIAKDAVYRYSKIANITIDIENEQDTSVVKMAAMTYSLYAQSYIEGLQEAQSKAGD